MPPSSVTFVLIARIPPEGISTFATYEDHVLPLLAEHGGVLQRRLRSGDGLVEIHVVYADSLSLVVVSQIRLQPSARSRATSVSIIVVPVPVLGGIAWSVTSSASGPNNR